MIYLPELEVPQGQMQASVQQHLSALPGHVEQVAPLELWAP